VILRSHRVVTWRTLYIEFTPQGILCIMYYLLDECMTLWGEPERAHVQNMEQLHVHRLYMTRHKYAIEHRTTSGHRVWNRNTGIKATESTDIWLTFNIQVAWCTREVNSSVVCNQQVGSRQHHHQEVTLQCSPPTLHPLTHCHWITWMCCLAWPRLFYLHRLSLSLCFCRLQCSSLFSTDSDTLCSLSHSLSSGVTSLGMFAPSPWLGVQGLWLLIWFHERL